MKRLKLVVFLATAAVTLGAFGGFALAQALVDDFPANNQPADCFDYYKFQNVDISIGTDKLEYNPGDTIKFRGPIINKNKYPVVDGYLYVRIAQKNNNYKTDGHNIIDEFFGAEKINLDTQVGKSVNFEWMVPKSLPGGDYAVSFFFSVGKKFNLAGLPFSNEITGGANNFKIKPNANQTIIFDRSKTKINGQKYFHIGQWPILGAGSSVLITQPVKNAHKETKLINVQYDLYYWDSLNEQDKIISKTEAVQVAGNSAKELLFKLDKIEQPSYYLKITATAGDDKAVVNIRFGSDLEKPRLNYPALTNFPIKSGEAVTLFTCFHSPSYLTAPGKVIAVLYDADNKEISRMNYEGDISPAMMLGKKDFIADKDYTYLKLKTEVYDSSNQLVDQYDNIYDCKELVSEKCDEMTFRAALPTGPSKNSSTIIFIAIGVFLLLLIIAIAYLYKKNKVNIGGVIVVLLAVIAVGCYTYSSFNTIGAKKLVAATIGNVNCSGTQCSRVVSEDYHHYIRHVSGSGCGVCAQGLVCCNDGLCQSSCLGNKKVVSGVVGVNHIASISRNQIPIGDIATFVYDPEAPTFTVTGGPWDTPYGEWRASAVRLRQGFGWTGGVDDIDFIRTAANRFYSSTPKGDGTYPPGWVFWTGVKPTNVTVTGIEGTGAVSCSGLTCTGTRLGNATIRVSIPVTPVYFWSFIEFLTKRDWYAHYGASDQDFTMSEDVNSTDPQWRDNVDINLPATSIEFDVQVIPVCGNGVTEGGEQCDAGAGNGTCPASCSLSCTNNNCCGNGICEAGLGETSETCLQDCCAPLNFISGLVSPSNILANGDYTIRCDYGNNSVDSINVIPGSGSCEWDSWDGTFAAFSCVADGTAGTFNNTCQVRPGTTSNNCPRADSVSGTLVVRNPISDAEPAGCSIPGEVVAGQPFTAYVSMENTGDIDWTNPSYKLSTTTSVWGPVKDFAILPVTEIIKPTFSHVFALNLIAPIAEGDYPFGWRMSGPSGFFGEINSGCSLGGSLDVKPIGFSLKKSNDLIVDLDADEPTGVRNSNTAKITVEPLPGFSGAYVDFSIVSGLPSGSSGTFALGRLPSAQFSSGTQFYVRNVLNSTQPGTRTIVIKGVSSNGAEATAEIDLKIISTGFINI